MAQYITPLESRHLLAIVGPEIVVPGSSPAISFDLAVADNGSCLVAALVEATADGPAKLLAQRYSAAGTPTCQPLTLATGLNQHDVSASLDADGDAVVAYLKDDGIYGVLVSKTNVVSAPVQIAPPPVTEEESLYGQSVSMDDAGGFFA